MLLGGAFTAAAQDASAVSEETVGQRVTLQGVVLYSATGAKLWVHSGDRAVQIDLPDGVSPDGATRPMTGQAVRVEGEVRPCNFRPCVAAERLEVVGTQALPEPERPLLHDVLRGMHYGQWVEIEATAQQVIRRDDAWWVRLGGEMPAVAVMPSGPPPAQGQRVRWRGVAGASYDDDRHFLGLVLYVPDASYAEPLVDPVSRTRPLLPIRAIGQSSAMPGTPVRVRGRVTFVLPGIRFFLQDSTGAVVVESTPPASLAVGDAVEVKGTVTSTSRGPAVREPVVTAIDARAVPEIEPVVATPAELARGRYARHLVTVRGEVEGIGRFTERTAFTLRQGEVSFEACGHDRHGGAMETSVEAGAEVRITGVADVLLWQAGRIGEPYEFWIETQEPREIEMLHAGAFWTNQRLGFGLGAVLLVGLSVALWAWTLRRRVRAHTAALRLERDHAQALRREAQAADRAKSAFLANMSHEIRTPLTAIIGFAQLLEEAGGDPDLSGRIERAGLRLLNTINSVLTFARLEAGRTEVRQEPIEIGSLVRQAVDALRPLALTKRLSLAVAVDPEADSAVALVDPAHLGRVMDNLIGNAVKFTEKGAVAVRVRADDERVQIVVSDTGPGIQASFLPHLFGEFEQETTGERRRFEGSGLGLAITKRLVEAMDGEITVNTVVGQGSSFVVTFRRIPDAGTPASGDGVAHGRDDEAPIRPPEPGVPNI